MPHHRGQSRTDVPTSNRNEQIRYLHVSALTVPLKTFEIKFCAVKFCTRRLFSENATAIHVTVEDLLLSRFDHSENSPRNNEYLGTLLAVD
jgi:hypothetical protein